MFHRAKKIPVAEKEKKEKKGKKKDEIVETVETKDDKTDTDMDKGSETGEEERLRNIFQILAVNWLLVSVIIIQRK